MSLIYSRLEKMCTKHSVMPFFTGSRQGVMPWWNVINIAKAVILDNNRANYTIVLQELLKKIRHKE
jgi:hypothetical protein